MSADMYTEVVLWSGTLGKYCYSQNTTNRTACYGTGRLVLFYKLQI